MKGSSQTQRYGGRGHSHALHGDKTFSQPIIWKTTLAMIFLHAGAVAALFVFTWQALILTIALWWISGSLGVGMGYHRLLTHRGYKTPKWVEYVLTTCGTLALEGGPIAWVATEFIIRTPTRKAIRAPLETAACGHI
jgi:fatty-acid desaturase